MRTHCYLWAGVLLFEWDFDEPGLPARLFVAPCVCHGSGERQTHMLALQTDFQRTTKTFPSQTGVLISSTHSSSSSSSVLCACRLHQYVQWTGRNRKAEDEWHKSACGARFSSVDMQGLIFIAGTDEEDATQTIFQCH